MVNLNNSSQEGPDSGHDLPGRDDALAEAAVLIVEPDERARVDIEERLLRSGFTKVMAVGSEAAAAEAAASSPPDVILLRADLDDRDGQGIASRLRETRQDRSLSVIFVTSNSDPAARKALLDRGDDCLTLPRDMTELPHRVSLHALLHIVGRTLRAERDSLEQIVEKRTKRLNRALDLLRDAEKRLERELSQARTETRERIDYFAETQHELRTPLNAICGMSDAMRNEMFGTIDNPKYKDYVNNIFQSGQHLLSIIDGRLEMSRIEAGADPVEIETVDVGGVITATADMLGPIAEKANVELKLDIEPNLPIVQTDPRKLRQILVNLVSNAIKFTPEKGRVTLTAKRNAQRGVLILVVSDTGIGMSANDIRDAMKPYRRLSGDRRSGERGTGLGLTIVHKLVETLGATIEIESTPGRGTSIKIELPMTVSGHAVPAKAVG
jgi:signal transduction histidine kinase